MLLAFRAVLMDLWEFIVLARKQATLSQNAPLLLTASPAQELLPAPPTTTPYRKEVVRGVLMAGRTVYIKHDNTQCFQRPVIAFDTRLGTLSYGQTVSVDVVEGQFAHVISDTVQGWVMASALTERRSDVYPECVLGEVYTHNNEVTIAIRTLLKDECFGALLGIPLQGVEYVLYELKRQGVSVPWPDIRPRDAGSWQTLLRGRRGVHSTVLPRTGAIMEYRTVTGIGALLLIREVHPDNSIKVTSVGRMTEGEYREEILTEAQWREWRPVFISFT